VDYAFALNKEFNPSDCKEQCKLCTRAEHNNIKIFDMTCVRCCCRCCCDCR